MTVSAYRWWKRWASGAPVVASRSGGVVETVKDRETGFIVEKNNAQQMAQALLRLLEDDALRESMGKAGRERALTYFTWVRLPRICASAIKR
jgi:spore coat protein SA